MAVKIQKGAALASLSLTPLIDIVFLLLIFFLVATRFAEEDRELDVMLPSASEAKPMIVKPKEVFINIDRGGQYFLGNQLMDAERLIETLKASAINNPLAQTVVIRADKRCQWDHVVAAIDACHRAGIHDIRPTTAGDGD
jgi:biopolymer transport protein ExbD